MVPKTQPVIPPERISERNRGKQPNYNVADVLLGDYEQLPGSLPRASRRRLPSRKVQANTAGDLGILDPTIDAGKAIATPTARSKKTSAGTMRASAKTRSAERPQSKPSSRAANTLTKVNEKEAAENGCHQDDSAEPMQLPTPETQASDSANTVIQPFGQVTPGEYSIPLLETELKVLPSPKHQQQDPAGEGINSSMSAALDDAAMEDIRDDSSELSSVPDDLDEQNAFLSTTTLLNTETVDTQSRSPRRRRSIRPIERFGQFVEITTAPSRSAATSTSPARQHAHVELRHKERDQPGQAHRSIPRKRKASYASPDSDGALEPDRAVKTQLKPDVEAPSLEAQSDSYSPAVPWAVGQELDETASENANSELAAEQQTAADSRVAKKPRKVRTSTARSGATVPRHPARKSRSSCVANTSMDTSVENYDITRPPESHEPPDNIDPALFTISQKLCQRLPIALKPGPQGQPEVWADSRQALCETVPYFKMPQSGCHQNDRHVYAFLFDGISHSREYMDSDVIIARAGGGMEQDGPGQMSQKKNHLISDAQVQSVINDIQHQNPLVIICGNKNAGAICRMPHRYNILGWFKPIAVWTEKTLGKGGKIFTTVKYRFERLDSSRLAWHAPSEQLLTTAERESVAPVVMHVCQSCGQDYATVYLNGWMCLNASCESFWKFASGQDGPYENLHYNPAFLLDRTGWANEEEPYSVRPPIPDVGNMIGDNLTHMNTRGICCPQCGRCNQRRLFRGWKCDNPNCTYQKFPKHIPVKPPMLHLPWESVGDGPALTRNKHEKGVSVAVGHRLGFKVFTYTFEGVKGTLVHAVSNARINRSAGGADEMFAAMQQQDDPAMDLHLERRKFGNSTKAANPRAGPVAVVSLDSDIWSLMRRAWQDIQQDQQIRAQNIEAVRGTVGMLDSSKSIVHNQESQQLSRSTAASNNQALAEAVAVAVDDDAAYMSAFAINYGMPYKFVASGASLPFQNSPWPIRACRADLNWASQNFLPPEGHQDLNELLVFAYLEGQKIEYHDDGECGLGPRIATMSLGGRAKMHLRMKSKHYTGCSKGSGILTADRPIPGTLEYEARLAAWEELQQVKSRNRRQYEIRRKELPKELGVYEKRSKKAEDLVIITLNHGDIVLMDGYEIQQYLEHKVVPEGCLRFALTCRTVLPEHLEPHELPSYGMETDERCMSSLVGMDGLERGDSCTDGGQR